MLLSNVANDASNNLFPVWFSKITISLKAALIAVTAITLTAAAPAYAGEEDGPYSDIVETSQTSMGQADNQFRSLFSSWKKMDNVTQSAVFIPSRKPVDQLTLTSNFGVRSDPFNGRARMHKGIDIPGPVGTPIYATADGIISRAQWVSGYGNFIEIGHGNGMETRYGHLSRIIAQPNQRVRRGQLIGYMGSTGRSTGSHLHYEVRVDGAAVNPLPFLQSADYLVAMNTKPPVAMGGPAGDSDKK